MAAIGRLYRALLAALAGLAAALVCLVFLAIIADVAMRSFGFKPPRFTTAFVEYSLLYFAVLSAPWLVRLRAHVFIDAITQKLPAAAHRVVAKFVYLVCVVSTLIFASISLRLLIGAVESGLMDERGIYLPQWLIYAPMPLSFLLVALEFGRMLIGHDSMYARDDIQDTL